jgi:hypothetical protein
MADFLIAAAAVGPAPPCPLIAYSPPDHLHASQITIDFRGQTCPTATDNGVPVRVHNGDPSCTAEDGVYLDGRASVRMDGIVFGGEFTFTISFKKDSGVISQTIDQQNYFGASETYLSRRAVLKETQETVGEIQGLYWAVHRVSDTEDIASFNSNGGSDLSLPHITAPRYDHWKHYALVQSEGKAVFYADGEDNGYFEAGKVPVIDRWDISIGSEPTQHIAGLEG